MIIKLNGLPWDGVSTPDTTNAIPKLCEDLSNQFEDFGQLFTGNPSFHTHDGWVIPLHPGVSSLPHQATLWDAVTYSYMKQTPVTDHMYKASVWGVESVAHVLTNLFGG